MHGEKSTIFLNNLIFEKKLILKSRNCSYIILELVSVIFNHFNYP